MIYDRPLTDLERKKSQSNYNRFCFTNGMSYMCLGESVIVLVAVQMNMPNTVISLIGAMIYLGYILLPLGVWATGKFGAARCQAHFWVCRNIAALLVAASVPVSMKFPVPAAGLLLIGAFFFYGFRAAGCVMGQPLLGNISSEEERPGLIAQSFALFYVAGLISLAAISILLHYCASQWALVGVVIFGATCGITASSFLRNMDETGDLRDSARKPMFDGLKKMLHSGIIMKMVCAWFAVNLFLVLVPPTSILCIKRGFHISDTQAILFTLCQVAACIVMSHVGIHFTRKFGPRKMIISGYLMVIPIALFWLLPIPEHISGMQKLLLVIPFILIGASSIIVNNAMAHYFLMTVSKEEQVNASMLINLVTGAGAGIAGIAISAGFMKLSEFFAGADTGPLLFKWFFMIVLVFLMALFPVLLRLETVIQEFRRKHGDEELAKTVHHLPGNFKFHR